MSHPTVSDEDARQFACEWIDAWNAHNLEEIIAHYAATVTLISPVAARLLPASEGRISGIEALRNYFARGLAAYPNLRFELIDVYRGVKSVVLLYRNQSGSTTAEFMEFDEAGKVERVVANYRA